VTVILPTPDQLRTVADQCGLSLTAEDVASFRGLMQGSIEAYDAVDAMPDEVPVVKCPRSLMPTTPMKATKLPELTASREDYVARALEMISNTSPFDITHHPAMSLPCGMVDGLPVGLMLVGKHFDEMTIYSAAHAFEQSGDWKKM
jgi:hypothetical protein